jgi:uncharacterized DUF497 family protein
LREAADAACTARWAGSCHPGRSFNSPLLLLADEKHSEIELRLHALGRTDEERLLHITFTLRKTGSLIRVISARDMHRKERTIYDQTG